MRAQIEARLAALKNEFDKGQTQLRQLESQSSSLREAMLRISGAIMVLEELLSPPTDYLLDYRINGKSYPSW
jgi:hypothetical protein